MAAEIEGSDSEVIPIVIRNAKDPTIRINQKYAIEYVSLQNLSVHRVQDRKKTKLGTATAFQGPPTSLEILTMTIPHRPTFELFGVWASLCAKPSDDHYAELLYKIACAVSDVAFAQLPTQVDNFSACKNIDGFRWSADKTPSDSDRNFVVTSMNGFLCMTAGMKSCHRSVSGGHAT